MSLVLVVEDDPLVREIMTRTLRDAGHITVEAEHGEQALDCVSREPVDLMVTDIMMPELDGIGLIREVRRLRPRLPIVCLSGGGRRGEMSYLRMAKSLGAHATLAKPFTPKQLLSAVDEALRIAGDPEPG